MSFVAGPQAPLLDTVSAIEQSVVHGIQQAGLANKRWTSVSPLSDFSRGCLSRRSSEVECFSERGASPTPKGH